ncbi:MAG: VCBS repeat-containing protein, partial [Bacteroidetes bacterium]|nr:VCBS repeat-containing protein [Bacteroidota bacterium]
MVEYIDWCSDMLRFAVFLFLLSQNAVHSSAQTFTDRSDLLPAGNSGSVYGAAVVDIDGDGRTDLFGPGRVLLRRSAGFEEVLIDAEDAPLGAVFGDVDGDGLPEGLILYVFDPDVYRYHSAREMFVPIPQGGIDVGSGFELAMGSLLLDYDNDGALDVFIGNDGGTDLLFQGQGDGTFVNVSNLLPVLPRTNYGAHAADYDRDGDIDIYLGICPVVENILYRNDGAGGFAEVAADAGLNDDRESWGVFWFDFDNDGWLDVCVTNHNSSEGLFRNQGDGTFTDVATAAGIAGPTDEKTWNLTAADFDNDGWVDVFVANEPQASRLSHNDWDGTFSDVTASS